MKLKQILEFMKRKWVLATIAFVAVALLATCIILINIKPQKMNNDNDVSIEVPVEPTKPQPTEPVEPEPVIPIDPIEPVEPEPVFPIEPIEPEPTPPNEIIGNILPFTFEDNQITGYTGNDTEVELPSTYSFAGYKTETYTFENAQQVNSWYNKLSSEEKKEGVVLQLANGDEYRITNVFNTTMQLSRIENAFPIIKEQQIKVFVEGDDIQIEKIGSGAFKSNKMKSIKIPSGYTEIGSYAFSSCTNLSEIEFPETLIKICDYAFNGCTSLTEVRFPNSLLEIAQSGFYSCTGLKTLNLPDSITTLGYLAFSKCTGLEHVVIPKNAVNLAYCIFEHCEGLKSAKVESNITLLPGEIFAHCPNLTHIELPDYLEGFDFCEFYGCSGLEYIKLPDNLNFIGERAFYGCSSLVELDLPESMEIIEVSSDYYQCGLIYGCNSLERIIIRSHKEINLTEIYKSYKNGIRCDIYVADELIAGYQELYPNLRFVALSTLI